MNTTPGSPASDASLEAAGTPPRRAPGPEHADTRADPEATLIECPMHTAMRQVAEAAVTQHVLYAEGVYWPREGLLHEMRVWLRLHELVRAFVCPATRGEDVQKPGDLDHALAELPVAMRASVAEAISVCGRRSRGEGCPLESEPAGRLIQ